MTPLDSLKSYAQSGGADERDAAFDEVVDEECSIEIRGVSFRASDVLFEFDRAAYKEALAEYREEQSKTIYDLVTQRFPHPIAHCFHRYLHGADTSSKRLLFLKETWDAIVTMLFAMCLGELRVRKIQVANLKIDREFVHSVMNRDRLALISETLGTEQKKLHLTSVVSEDIVRQMVDLNNEWEGDFASIAKLNERKAEQLIEQIEPMFVEILRALAELENVKLLRYVGPGSSGQHQTEIFTGESTSRRIDKKFKLSSRHTDTLSRRGLRNDEVYVMHDDQFYCVSPIIGCRIDQRPHHTELSSLKKVNGSGSKRKVIFELFNDSEEYEDDQQRVLDDIDGLKAMFNC